MPVKDQDRQGNSRIITLFRDNRVNWKRGKTRCKDDANYQQTESF